MILLALTNALAGCDEPATNIGLENTTSAALDAFVKMESQTFADGAETAMAMVPCLAETVTPSNAATVMRMQGLQLFLADDPAAAQLYFAGARKIEPTYRFPETIAPEGNPLLDDYLALDITADSPRALPNLVSGSYRINGLTTAERSANYPVLFQQIDADGLVVVSGLLQSDQSAPITGALVPDPVPDPALPPDQPVEPVEPNPSRKNGAKLPLLIGGAVLGVAAGGLLAGNRLSLGGYNTHYDEKLAGVTAPSSADVATYDRQRGTTNALGLATYGTGAAAAGLVISSLALSGSF